MNRRSQAISGAFVMASIGLGAGSAAVAATPPIRLTAANQVPACVTPARLDAFLEDQISRRGYQIHPPHRKIAKWYRHHGETQRVRWDYAFFQMALETNFLSFRRSNGKRGDVHPSQNNFAGLGTTGGGVPGDRYPDASTGVLAQIQHLVVYSGQRLRRPTGHRTRLKQNVILQSVRKIVRRRPVTFADLAGRWAADRRYGRSIQRLAERFYTQYCPGGLRQASRPSVRPIRPNRPGRLIPTTVTGGNVKGPVVRKVLQVARPAKTTQLNDSRGRRTARALAQPQRLAKPSATRGRSQTQALRSFVPATRTAPPPAAYYSFSKPDARPTPDPAVHCKVQTAGYGGKQAVLIRSVSAGTVHLTALGVYPGFESTMAQSFIESHAPDGQVLGAFPSRQAAVANAQALCRQHATRSTN